MKINAKDFSLIIKLADRGVKLASKLGHDDFERADFSLPLAECHMALPLDLKRLSEFNDGDFAHDLFGIRRHFDDGKLHDCFLPRCAKL